MVPGIVKGGQIAKAGAQQFCREGTIAEGGKGGEVPERGGEGTEGVDLYYCTNLA